MQHQPARQPVVDPVTWGATMPRPPVASSDGLGWRHMTARRFHHVPADFAAPPLSHHLVTLFLAGPAPLDWLLDGRRLTGLAQPGRIMIMAAGQENVWHWTGTPDVLHLYLHPDYLTQVADELGLRGVTLIDGFDRVDPLLFSLGRHVLSEIEDGGDSLAGEALAQLVAIQLLRAHTAARQPLPGTTRLPPWRLKRVTELVESRLEGDLTIATMADAAGLSTYHFSRCFKAATGRPPHRYLLERRIERAKRLLAGTGQEIVQVALAAGFASQEHMTTVFRRLTGTTPARYRRLARD